MNTNVHAIPPCCDLPRPGSLPTDERRVLEVLIPCVGKARAIGKRELTYAAGMLREGTGAPNEKRARDAVFSLIVDHGVPICSSTSATKGGYFLPETHAEIAAARDTIQSYVRHHQQRLDAYERALREDCDLFGYKN
jgi:hypothetical protein|tara:strand:- start:294 stop:704 length:411 start_codon:yes stop_codon:yes gene_type:complete